MWTDSKGRDWHTTITVSTVNRVKKLVDILLTDVVDGNLIVRLNDDIVLLANVLFAICEPQATDRGISDVEFGELLAGEIIERAHQSLIDDLILFFPPSRRPALEKMRAATAKLEAAQIAMMETKLSSEQINQIIKAEVAKTSRDIDQHLAALGNDSGKSPESSGSTPTP